MITSNRKKKVKKRLRFNRSKKNSEKNKSVDSEIAYIVSDWKK